METKLKGEIISLGVKQGIVKLTIDVALGDMNIEETSNLLEKSVAITIRYNQSTLPEAEE